MSLWTPSGEHPVGDEGGTPAHAGPRPGAGPGPATPGGGSPGGGSPGADFDAAPHDAAAVDDLRRQLADAPAEVVVANHCYGLFELAAVYLSQAPPRFDQAQLAIDALGHLVDGLDERLGEAHGPLRDALAQVRLAFVQLSAAEQRRTAGDQAEAGTAG